MPQIKNSPLLLERYYLSGVHLDSNDELQTKEIPEFQIQSTVGVASHNSDPRRWKVLLTVGLLPVKETLAHYKGSVSFTGYFAVDPNYPADKVKLLVETNAPSILFGAAREMLCNLTARGPWPMVTLPTQSFYQPPTKVESPSLPAAAK